MYKFTEWLKDKHTRELECAAEGVKWKINKGPEVDYKTFQSVIPLIKGIPLPWPESRWYKAMFICIPGGGRIKRHSDGGGVDSDCLGLTTKYHIVLSTNENCANYSWCGYKQHIHLYRSGVYKFDPLPEHASYNLGATDRIHLVIDIYDNEH